MREDWKKNKDNYIWFIIIFLLFSVGDILWISAEGEWRDVGIIITTLSCAGFWWWGLRKPKE